MHEARRAVDGGAERHAERLVAEADAEDRHVRAGSRIRSTQTPASSGRPGPGESTMPSGSRASIAAALSASLRSTSTSAPAAVSICTRL